MQDNSPSSPGGTATRNENKTEAPVSNSNCSMAAIRLCWTEPAVGDTNYSSQGAISPWKGPKRRLSTPRSSLVLSPMPENGRMAKRSSQDLRAFPTIVSTPRLEDENERVFEAFLPDDSRELPEPFPRRPHCALKPLPKAPRRLFDRTRFIHNYGHLFEGKEKETKETCPRCLGVDTTPENPLETWLQRGRTASSAGHGRKVEFAHNKKAINCRTCQRCVRKDIMRCMERPTPLSSYLLPAVAVDVIMRKRHQRRGCKVRIESEDKEGDEDTSSSLEKEEPKEQGCQTSKFVFGKFGFDEVEPGQLICPSRRSEFRHSQVLSLPTSTSGPALLRSFLPREIKVLLRLLMGNSAPPEATWPMLIPGSSPSVQRRARRRILTARAASSVESLTPEPTASQQALVGESLVKLEKLISLLMHFPATVQQIKMRGHVYKARKMDHVCAKECFEWKGVREKSIDHATLFKELITLIKALRKESDLMDKLLKGYDDLVSLEK